MAKQSSEQHQPLLSHQLVTINDLERFRDDLLVAIRELLKPVTNQSVSKWLKSKDVRKILNISPGTLQSLRVNGVLPYTKVGGAMYYNTDDIEKLLRNGLDETIP